MEIEILYRDKSIVVCIKPVGISSESTETGDGLCDILAKQLGEKYVAVLHRLDVGVGGLMVYALNHEAAKVLSRDIAEGNMHKYYTASFYGDMQEQTGAFEDLLFKDSKRNKTFVVDRERKGVKKAKLSYRVLDKKTDSDGRTVTTAEIYLYTGRSHQIRAQFSHRGMPLVGDGKYGAKDNVKNIALKCTKIILEHPVTKQQLEWQI